MLIGIEQFSSYLYEFDLIYIIISSLMGLDPLTVVFNILDALYLIPAVLAVLNFRQVRSYDYLIITGMLGGNGISSLILGFLFYDPNMKTYFHFYPLYVVFFLIFLLTTNLGLI